MITIILFSFPYFVIWKNIAERLKNYIIIDIKTFNQIIISNVYLISL